MVKKAIIITGTPGTGKSEIARKLSLYLKRRLVSATEYAKEHGLFERYDRKRSTYEVDPAKLARKLAVLVEKSEESLIIEGHMSHFLPRKSVCCCIVCKTDLKKLKKRLEKRRYSSIKIRENLDSEIFDICLHESIERGHKPVVLDTSGAVSESMTRLKKLLKKA